MSHWDEIQHVGLNYSRDPTSVRERGMEKGNNEEELKIKDDTKTRKGKVSKRGAIQDRGFQGTWANFVGQLYGAGAPSLQNAS